MHTTFSPTHRSVRSMISMERLDSLARAEPVAEWVVSLPRTSSLTSSEVVAAADVEAVPQAPAVARMLHTD